MPSSDDTKVIYPKSIIFNGEAQLYMSEVTRKNDYYRVYGMGELSLLTGNPAQAIAQADEQAGVVVAPSEALYGTDIRQIQPKSLFRIAISQNRLWI